MERKNAMSLSYKKLRLFNSPALFTEWRVIRDTVPTGMTLYELRHAAENWNKPCQLAKRIVVNYYGSILTPTPIQLAPDGGREIVKGDWRYTRNTEISITDFLLQHPINESDIMSLSVLEPTEAHLFFSQDEGIDKSNGCVGHLRGDFGNGYQFYTTWWPHQDDRLNQKDFKTDLQRVVDWLRQDYSPLKDLSSMVAFCRRYGSQSALPQAILPSHGFRIDTRRFQYMLRCFPEKGDYNFYIYCYDKDNRETAHTLAKVNKQPVSQKKYEQER